MAVSQRDVTPRDVLLLRGRATVEVQPGVVPEYAAAKRYMARMAAVSGSPRSKIRACTWPGIGMRPARVGTLDFQKRLPGSMGGVRGLIGYYR